MRSVKDFISLTSAYALAIPLPHRPILSLIVYGQRISAWTGFEHPTSVYIPAGKPDRQTDRQTCTQADRQRISLALPSSSLSRKGRRFGDRQKAFDIVCPDLVIVKLTERVSVQKRSNRTNSIRRKGDEGGDKQRTIDLVTLKLTLQTTDKL